MRKLALLVVASAAVGLGASLSPGPSPPPPKVVKVAPMSALLVESPEMFQECMEARDRERALREQLRQANEDEERARAGYRPATKPIGDMTPEEYEGYKAGRAQLDKALAAVKTYTARLESARDDLSKLCFDAALASVLKGTILTVLREKDGLFNVRVETGRAAGKNGWILSTDVDPVESAASPSPSPKGRVP